ncbi:DUF7009 family protein [Flagellimonas iocasae]|uniref:DUF7009 family protein n=1 Tax=Flagellimonas iocasae TaxID=2055905 RepID=A0ABW4XVP3_9FLAO
MKIRIKGDSIRYRLTKTEVEIFCKDGSYQETTDFGSVLFTYVLKAKKAIASLEASFENNIITLYLPDEAQATWATSDRVGYQGLMDFTDGKQLSLLVEKDFVCLDETIEDQSDNYPNPLANKK